mmetsp:Transcript_44218/g.127776  ORF Transcript_44218/g.127776 Transcript_44218/m.127776 type:complete len:629 (-) Transcript_44218:55-1941(-)
MMIHPPTSPPMRMPPYAPDYRAQWAWKVPGSTGVFGQAFAGAPADAIGLRLPPPHLAGSAVPGCHAALASSQVPHQHLVPGGLRAAVERVATQPWAHLPQHGLMASGPPTPSTSSSSRSAATGFGSQAPCSPAEHPQLAKTRRARTGQRADHSVPRAARTVDKLRDLRQTLDVAQRCGMALPQDLLRRIEALEARACAATAVAPPPVARQRPASPRRRRTPPRGSRERRSGTSPRCGGAEAEGGGVGSSPLAPLSERIRRFHELLNDRGRAVLLQHLGKGDEEGDDTSVPRDLRRVVEAQVAEPLDRFQSSLELLAAEQRRLQLQQEEHIRRLQEQGARQEQMHCEQVLQLEEALLSQSLRREAELAEELRELEGEWQELEAVDERLASDATPRQEPGPWVSTASGPCPWGSGSAQRPHEAADEHLASDAALRQELAHGGRCAERFIDTTPLSSEPHTVVPDERAAGLCQQSLDTQDELDCAASSVPESGGRTMGEAPVVGHRPACDDSAEWRPSAREVLRSLPAVYQAAVALVLEHGWEVLHGGAHAGEPAWTALHWAAAEGRLDVCRLLLGCAGGAEFVQRRDELGRSPLDYAVEGGHQAIVELLIQALGCQASPAMAWMVGEQRV